MTAELAELGSATFGDTLTDLAQFQAVAGRAILEQSGLEADLVLFLETFGMEPCVAEVLFATAITYVEHAARSRVAVLQLGHCL